MYTNCSVKLISFSIKFMERHLEGIWVKFVRLVSHAFLSDVTITLSQALLSCYC